MAKSKTVFVCQECAYEAPKWVGRNASKIINKNINIIGIASLKDVLSVIF